MKKIKKLKDNQSLISKDSLTQVPLFHSSVLFNDFPFKIISLSLK